MHTYGMREATTTDVVIVTITRIRLNVAWSVYMCVSLLGTQVSPAKTDELIEMLFGADSRGSKKTCIRWKSRLAPSGEYN